jgi:hypothetical protein
MQTPEALKKRIKELNLDLVETQPSQVWRLKEPAAESPPETSSQYAAREADAARVQ